MAMKESSHPSLNSLQPLPRVTTLTPVSYKASNHSVSRNSTPKRFQRRRQQLIEQKLALAAASKVSEAAGTSAARAEHNKKRDTPNESNITIPNQHEIPAGLEVQADTSWSSLFAGKAAQLARSAQDHFVAKGRNHGFETIEEQEKIRAATPGNIR